MCSLLSLLKVELGSAEDNLMTMSHKILDELLEVKRTWTTVYKGHVVYRKA